MQVKQLIRSEGENKLGKEWLIAAIVLRPDEPQKAPKTRFASCASSRPKIKAKA